MEHAEQKRRITKAYQMANAELRERHRSEFQLLYDFYREYLKVPRQRERSDIDDRPAAPPAPTSTRKGKQRQQ